jgi:branched-chain amino acid transport system substrate-binding protein
MSIIGGAALLCLAVAAPGHAAGTYDQGASDTAIKLGNTFPYSGPGSPTAIFSRQMAGYFNMVNEQGGVNGRKIDFISLDDGYLPPKTVELTRRLIEQDQVLAIFGSEGTPTQLAVRPYLNTRKVPQLFPFTGSNTLIDPKKFPYTVELGPSYGLEGVVWAKYILAERPNAKIGIFYQDDDFGSDHMGPFLATLGDKAKTMVVAKESYLSTDPTVTSQIISLRSAGADTFVIFATARQAAQAVSVTRDQAGPDATIFVPYAASARSILAPVGDEKLKGILSTDTAMDPTDPDLADDPAVKDYLAFVKKYTPASDQASDASSPAGYIAAQVMADVLKRCGDDLTRANVMNVVTHIEDWRSPLFLPGIKLNTTPDDYFALHTTQLKQYNGTRWVMIGKPISDD